MMNSNIKNGPEKTKEMENKTGGSYEKEQLPDNLADIKSLRSIFEPQTVRKDVKQTIQTPPPDEPQTNSAPSVHLQMVDHGEDTVDSSQPSMVDLLSKFRQLELETAQIRNAQSRSPRKLKADEYMQRSASLDRKANLTYERKVRETPRSALNGMTIDERLQAAKVKPVKSNTNQEQTQKQPHKGLSETEQETFAGGSKTESIVSNGYNVSVDSIKRSLGDSTVKVIAEKQISHEELPSEGIVKTLLNQWKTLEEVGQKSLEINQKKKKRVRFGVDSSWFPQNQANPGNASTKQIKSCLKPTTPTIATDKNNKKAPVLHVAAPNHKKPTLQGDKAISKAPKTISNQPPTTTNSTKNQSPPPDVVSQVLENQTKPEDELPPPSNTKTLLDKFRALQTQTSK